MDIVGLLTVFSFLHQGLALSCYECNSRDNATCREHPPDSARTGCTQDKPVCRVIYLEVNAVIEGRTPHSRVIRSCGQMEETEEAKPCYRISDYGALQIVCSCTEDNCNSSTKPAATVLVVATVVLVTLFC